jgi:hypothetical protein
MICQNSSIILINPVSRGEVWAGAVFGKVFTKKKPYCKMVNQDENERNV